MKNHLTEFTLLSVLMLSTLSSGTAIARGGGGRGHHSAGHAAHAATHSRGYRFSGYPMRPHYYYAPLTTISPAQRFCVSTGLYFIDARECPDTYVQQPLEPALRYNGR
jgi:hypothetical protein